jgi:hypothetical protein
MERDATNFRLFFPFLYGKKSFRHLISQQDDLLPLQVSSLNYFIAVVVIPLLLIPTYCWCCIKDVLMILLFYGILFFAQMKN